MTAADVIQPSASIASTGLGIRYIGKDHCYAFSGNVAADVVGTVLDFTTGSGYVNGTFTFSGFLDQDNPALGLRGTCIVYFNDLIVTSAASDFDTGNMVTPAQMPMLIPPFTKVKVIIYANSASADYHATTTFTGRVYGAD